MVLRMWRNWLGRHGNATNLALHAAGVPMTVAAAALALTRDWLPAAGLFIGGYALQMLGHVVEGNRSGEERLLRRLLRRSGT